MNKADKEWGPADLVLFVKYALRRRGPTVKDVRRRAIMPLSQVKYEYFLYVIHSMGQNEPVGEAIKKSLLFFRSQRSNARTDDVFYRQFRTPTSGQTLVVW
jgi:hypothetical protein